MGIARGAVASGNHTAVTHFFFEPFSNALEIQIVLFFLVLLMYISTLVGNLVIIMISVVDSALHSPMYFFLRNLSFLEIAYTSSSIPKFLVDSFAYDKSISFVGCAMQMYFFGLLGITECCLLAAMAYDRYVAVCHPLRYTTMVSHTVCLQLSGACWFLGVLVNVWQTTFIFTLPFCGPNIINHFFCDQLPVLKLACVDTFRIEVHIYIIAVVFIMVPFLLILVSYAWILHTIFNMPSAEGRKKTFSTCFSHLLVVTLFYVPAIVTYLMPKSSHSHNSNRLLSLFYSVMSPMMNPLIYSLRNKEVKQALRRLISRKRSLK
ncbi:olfactory receptor 10A4-like [Alligator mississippiensis]|uniref:olfactory receptor 10A4-like n=1 Tax=Alligator mississippiensis TaxID=8496 RepID=UPI0007119428|nr:olfactory receptor 10A4-like [Alligator mississippiensis]